MRREAAARSLLGSAAALAVMALWEPATSPASAHEFTVVLVSDGSAQSRDARRGFDVAVDLSPDVSHAPGPDAGDHLGGVDVDLVVIDDGASSGTAERVGELLDGGASAVVVLAVPSTADSIAAAAAQRDKLALVVDDSGGSSARRAALLLRPLDAVSGDEVGVAAAARAFLDATGDDATRAALLGYDAGRLLDELVGRGGDGLRPGEPLIEAALSAGAELSVSSVTASADAAAVGDSTGGDDDGTGEAGRRAPPLGAAAIGAAAIAAAAVVASAVVVVTRRRLRRHPTR